jgi:hypothetical protein
MIVSTSLKPWPDSSDDSKGLRDDSCIIQHKNDLIEQLELEVASFFELLLT